MDSQKANIGKGPHSEGLDKSPPNTSKNDSSLKNITRPEVTENTRENILVKFEKDNNFLKSQKTGAESSHGKLEELETSTSMEIDLQGSFPYKHFNTMKRFNIAILKDLRGDDKISEEVRSKIQPILAFHEYLEKPKTGKEPVNNDIGWKAADAYKDLENDVSDFSWDRIADKSFWETQTLYNKLTGGMLEDQLAVEQKKILEKMPDLESWSYIRNIHENYLSFYKGQLNESSDDMKKEFTDMLRYTRALLDYNDSGQQYLEKLCWQNLVIRAYEQGYTPGDQQSPGHLYLAVRNSVSARFWDAFPADRPSDQQGEPTHLRMEKLFQEMKLAETKVEFNISDVLVSLGEVEPPSPSTVKGLSDGEMEIEDSSSKKILERPSTSTESRAELAIQRKGWDITPSTNNDSVFEFAPSTDSPDQLTIEEFNDFCQEKLEARLRAIALRGVEKLKDDIPLTLYSKAQEALSKPQPNDVVYLYQTTKIACWYIKPVLTEEGYVGNIQSNNSHGIEREVIKKLVTNERDSAYSSTYKKYFVRGIDKGVFKESKKFFISVDDYFGNSKSGTGNAIQVIIEGNDKIFITDSLRRLSEREHEGDSEYISNEKKHQADGWEFHSIDPYS